MSNVTANTRRLAEHSAAQVKSTFDKTGAAATEQTRRAEQSALTAFSEAREIGRAHV